MSIEELKRAIEQKVIFESCDTWTNRLYCLTKDKFEYLNTHYCRESDDESFEKKL